MPENTLSCPAGDTAGLRGRFVRDGVVQVDGVLGPAEVDEIRTVFMTQVESDRETVGEEADAAQSFTTGVVRPPAGMHATQTQMQPGDVLFFHGSAVHGSLPNTSDRFRRSLIFHYVPQASVEIARMYLPLVAPDGRWIRIAEATGGGPCGEGWGGAAH